MVTAIVSIIMFLALISFHEFGHFIVGKILKFKIDEFSIGMGPLIFKKQKGETQYSLRLLPLGGYCKFEGEDDADTQSDRAFANQKPWKRLAVLVAGGVFNIILGFMLFVCIVPAISPVSTNVTETVVAGSYAEQSGMLPDDRIIAVNGKGVSCFNDIALYSQNFKKDENATIKVKRGNEKFEFEFKPSEQLIEKNYIDSGVYVRISVNGVLNDRYYAPYSENNPRDESLIGTTQTITRYTMGFSLQKMDINALNVWGEAWNRTKFVVKLVYQSFWQIVTGKIGIQEVSGPVGIVKEVNTAVNSGDESWLDVLNLIALLTINLGIFNLLPIPALDGGRILFVLWEMVTRKRIPPDKEGIIHAVGMALLLLLVLVISFKDVMSLFGG